MVKVSPWFPFDLIYIMFAKSHGPAQNSSHWRHVNTLPRCIVGGGGGDDEREAWVVLRSMSTVTSLGIDLAVCRRFYWIIYEGIPWICLVGSFERVERFIQFDFIKFIAFSS